MRGSIVATYSGLDFFQTIGSSEWPSNNPEDSPLDTFTCLRCHWKFESRMHGEFPVDVNPISRPQEIMKMHKESRCEFINKDNWGGGTL